MLALSETESGLIGLFEADEIGYQTVKMNNVPMELQPLSEIGLVSVTEDTELVKDLLNVCAPDELETEQTVGGTVAKD